MPIDDESKVIAFRANGDLALALGYANAQAYNDACTDKPDEVRARIAGLG